VAVYFIVSRLYKFKEWHLLFFAVTGALISLIAMFQFFNVDPLGGIEAAANPGKAHFAKRYLSTIGNIDFLSWYIAMIYSLTVPMFVLAKSKYTNWLLLPLAIHSAAFYYIDVDSGKIAVAASLVVLLFLAVRSRAYLSRLLNAIALIFGAKFACAAYFTAYYNDYTHMGGLTRSLLIALAALAAAAAVRWIKLPAGLTSKLNGKRRMLILLGIIAGAGVAGIAVLRILPQSSFSGILGDISNILHGDIPDELGTNRVYTWRRSLILFSEHPIFGAGQDSFGALFTRYSEDLQRLFPGEYVDKAHNIYIQMLVCTGGLSLISYLVFLGGAFYTGFKKGLKSVGAAALLLALVSYSVQAAALFSLPFVTPIFWVAAGMLVTIQKDKKL
jgi:O-antigen ligase